MWTVCPPTCVNRGRADISIKFVSAVYRKWYHFSYKDYVNYLNQWLALALTYF